MFTHVLSEILPQRDAYVSLEVDASRFGNFILEKPRCWTHVVPDPQFTTVWMSTLRILFESQTLFRGKLCFYILLLQNLRFRARNRSHLRYFKPEIKLIIL